MLLSDYVTQIRVLVHDLNKNDWTDPELITIVNAARQRISLDLHCVRNFQGGPSQLAGGFPQQINAVANQEVYPINSGIPGTIITQPMASVNPPASYLVAPIVTFSLPPSGGIQATGTAVLGTQTANLGNIIAINMTNWGSGYVPSSPPTISFSTGQAAATPITFFNVLDILSISYLWPGSTNRQMLKWLPFTTFNAWLRMYTGQIGTPYAWTTHDGANQLYIFPIPDQQYVLEFDTITLSTDLVNLTDFDKQVLQPFADCVQYYGAFLARTKLQDYEKADYWRKLYNTRAREVNATRQDRRIPSIYRSSARRMMRW